MTFGQRSDSAAQTQPNRAWSRRIRAATQGPQTRINARKPGHAAGLPCRFASRRSPVRSRLAPPFVRRSNRPGLWKGGRGLGVRGGHGACSAAARRAPGASLSVFLGAEPGTKTEPRPLPRASHGAGRTAGPSAGCRDGLLIRSDRARTSSWPPWRSRGQRRARRPARPWQPVRRGRAGPNRTGRAAP